MAGNTPTITIEKLSADLYADKRTGEVKEFQHHDSRAADKASLSRSLRKLRDLINSNLQNLETALWVTLTYRENMTDPTRLYEDYRRFWQRLIKITRMSLAIARNIFLRFSAWISILSLE